MPKFILNASGDQFFLPDSSQFYFDGLPGEKHLRYVPNADHSLSKSDALESIHAFYAAIVTGTPRPGMKWSFERDGPSRSSRSSCRLESKSGKPSIPRRGASVWIGSVRPTKPPT